MPQASRLWKVKVFKIENNSANSRKCKNKYVPNYEELYELDDSNSEIGFNNYKEYRKSNLDWS